MRTVGVDLAAEPARTALAFVDWDTHQAAITEVIRGARDEMILAALAHAGKAGIDCPLGWPDALVDLVADHQSGHVTVPGGLTGQQWRRQLAWRGPMRRCARNGPDPLSVAADRIGHAAVRCASCSRSWPARTGRSTAVAAVSWWRSIPQRP